MFDAFVPCDLNGDGLVDWVFTRGNSGAFSGTYWLEQVRTAEPGPSFRAARAKDSLELPWPVRRRRQ